VGHVSRSQAVVGGQPLLIVGVAEPIVLIYGYMYNFARDKPDLGMFE
jgi:boron transporter